MYGNPQTAAGFSSASSPSYFQPCLRQKSHLHFLGRVLFVITPPSTPPHLSLLSLSLTNKSLFNPRLDYNSEVIAWPSSSSPLSRGPPPNLEEQLFINVLLTSLLQCNAGKGSPPGIVLMGEGKSAPGEADHNEKRPANWAERRLMRPGPRHPPPWITESRPTN